MRATHPEHSSSHGSARYRLADLQEIGIQNQVIGVGGNFDGNPVNISGFLHFQIWILTANAGNVNVNIRGVYPDVTGPLNFSLPMNVGTLAFGGPQVGTLYFGASLAPTASVSGDLYRVGSFIIINLANAGGAPVTISECWMECTG